MKLSIVIPLHNEARNIPTLYRRICTVLQREPVSWEMICVNDGSRDGTLEELLALQRQDARIRVIDLSRNFGKEAALSAGLDYASGDAIIPFDADLQDPPEVIPALLAKWREGYEIVNAVRESREGEGWRKRLTAHLFYRVINRLSDVEIPQNTGDFRLISRPVLTALKRLPERRRFMKGLFAWVGFRTATVTYRRARRHAGATNWSYWKLWNFALEGITSFSSVPLRLSSYLGFIVSIFSFIEAVRLVVGTFIFGNPVKGYPSLMVAVLFLGGVQLIALGMIGEYLGRLYEESKQRPIYLIRQIWESSSPQCPVMTPAGVGVDPIVPPALPLPPCTGLSGEN